MTLTVSSTFEAAKASQAEIEIQLASLTKISWPKFREHILKLEKKFRKPITIIHQKSKTS